MRRLLDVNVLMALLWRDHVHHDNAKAWLKTIEQFATCPLGQLGFARVSSQPALGFAFDPEQAFGLLRPLLADRRHRFVPDDLGADDRELRTDLIRRASQVSDHYLVAIARRHGMRLATFDAGIHRALADEPGLVELVD